MTYELTDHTADVGIRASGEDLEEAFEESAKGMFSVITDISKVERVKEYDIEIEKDDIEGLLVNFLSELIYLHEVKSVLFSDFDVEIEENEKTDSKKLTATAFGEDIDLEKHDMETAVKAVSYHELSIDPKGNIKILLDI